MRLITTCEVCDSDELIPLLDLGSQPMCDDLVPIGSNAKPTAYPLRMMGCPRCVTVHQAAQIEKQILFPRTYHYRAALTKDVLDGMRELVESVDDFVGGLIGKQVLDIGCNDGSLLAIFRERGARTAGIEPTGAFSDARGRVDWLHNGFFDAKAVEAYLLSNPTPDVITFTNVFAHIEDLNGLVHNLKQLMSPTTELVIENHYLGAVVERMQFDTFYHEHPRTYSLQSFKYIARKLNRTLKYVTFPSRYNGNIRVVISSSEASQTIDKDESFFLDAVKSMQDHISFMRARTQERLRSLVKEYGPLPAKAFPGRAAILIHSLGINEKIIDTTYERPGSPKIGNYVPGTLIEIKDESEFFDRRMQAPVVINLAWHIQSEIERYMRSKGYQGEIIPVVS